MPMLLSLLLLMMRQPAELPIAAETLDSGLRVVVVEDHATPLVAVQLWINTGWSIDPPDAPGLMRLTQATLRAAGDADRRLRGLGLQPEARCSADACMFDVLLPPPLLGEVLAAEAARLGAGAPTSEQVASALGDLRADDGDAAAGAERDEALALLFKGMPYAGGSRPPGDWASKAGAAERVREAVKRWTAPANCAVVIVGDVTGEQAIKLAREAFAKLQWAESPRRPWPEAPDADELHAAAGKGDKAAIEFTWLTPSFTAFEHAAITVLMQRLCNEFDGALREFTPSFEVRRYRDAGYVRLIAPGAKEGDVRAALARMSDEPLDAVAFDRARALAGRELRGARLSMRERARELGRCEVIGGDALLYTVEMPRLQRLSGVDLQTAARYLQRARRVIREIKPGAATTSPASAVASDSAAPSATSRAAREEGKLVDAAVKLPAAPLPTATRSQLIPGVELVTCATRGAEAVFSRALADRLSSDDFLRLLTLAKGSPRLRGRLWEDYATLRGLRIDVAVSNERGGVEGHAARDDLDRLLECELDAVRRNSRDLPGAEPGLGPTEIVIVGDVDFEALRKHAIELAREMPPHVAPPAADLRDDTPGVRISLEPTESASAWVTISFESSRFVPIANIARAFGRLFGEPGRINDADGKPCDWMYSIGNQDFVLTRHVAAGEAAGAVAKALARLKACQAGEIPGDEREAALRRGNIDAWLAWDEPGQIADTAAARDCVQIRDADELGGALREVLRGVQVRVLVVGPGSLEEGLRGLGTLSVNGM